jgi:D-serine deaminase-like pyridoxal phosphate-dependent protein
VLLSELATPQVLIDRSRLVRNIGRVQDLAKSTGASLRPHSKTHKSPLIARWQVDRGAVGICCAKVGEAEVMAAAGIHNIRLAYPVDPSNAARVSALLERADISIVVDDLSVARRWSDAMHRKTRVLDVLVKVDVGFHRCGIDPRATTALDFLCTVAQLPGLRLRGLLSHAGHSYFAGSDAELATIARQEAAILLTLRQRAAQAGLALEEISVGATPTLRYAAEQQGITELRPGNYVYFDRTQLELGAASLEDCALTVLATVVSKPAADRMILDCGSKTLTSDAARGFQPITGYGAMLTSDGTSLDHNFLIERLSEEHATVRIARPTPLAPGDRVRVLPNHACTVANMVDQAQLIEGDRVIETLSVDARGKIT